MMESMARQMPLQSIICKLNKGLSLSANDSRKPINQAVFATLPTDDRGRTAYLNCIKDGKNIDPATGTGTFLAEIVKQIYKQFEGQEGIWSNYVEEHLIPRLNGFEILMAPYTMCHLKLETLLRDTGYKPKDEKKQKRLQAYLTNSLEEAHPDTGTLFASWLSRESIEANYIKKETPVMVVLGNPPYSVSSSNKGEWIKNLISDYKKDLNEKKINLDDDYIKFIRYGQYLIDKNSNGILAYISNNSFIDGITHRQMRKRLLESFDTIYILDLHGSAKKKETCPDGLHDQNVFDIMQGVSINVFIKTGKKKKSELGQVFYGELLGKRDLKYKTLENSLFYRFNWVELNTIEPYNFFIPKNFSSSIDNQKSFKIDEIYHFLNSGIQSKNDKLTIQFTEQEINNVINDFSEKTEEELNLKYKINPDGIWNTKSAKKDILLKEYVFTKILYRPFDYRFTVLTKKSSGFLGRPRYEIMKHIISKNNLSLIVNKQFIGNDFNHVGITKFINCHGTFYLGNKAQDYICPLYLYPTEGSLVTNRTPNLNMEMVNQIAKNIGLRFTTEKEVAGGTFAPIDILDYIYAVLHSPIYREKYNEYLKIDFPRVPYPENAETFWNLVKLGGELRQIHLLESPIVDHFITKFPIGGNNQVKKVAFDSGKVWINDTQFFDCVPEIAWNFYIGGYQPAQKWLKDRKGRELTFDDICHYQKIIVALFETDRIMKEIDKVVSF